MSKDNYKDSGVYYHSTCDWETKELLEEIFRSLQEETEGDKDE